jgi:hypothetical protein
LTQYFALFLYFPRFLILDGADCLENKLCLISWNNSWRDHGNGRGGLGKDLYVYAILDWESKATRRQERFELAGGVGRATVQTMRDYFGDDNTRFPPEVRSSDDVENFLQGNIV